MSALRDALLVGAGGALGSLARWLATDVVQRWMPEIPLGTWVVNVLGSLSAGAVLAALQARSGAEELRLFVAIGFLGGFTTFSSFAVDALLLVREGRTALALGYVAGSVALGLAAAGLGWAAARSWIG
jgi:CrcB protein